MGQALVLAEVYMRGRLGLVFAGRDVYVASSFAAAASFLWMFNRNFGGVKCVNV